jgi:uncharacterized membrane protein YjjP (DUF1212 family)
MPLGWLLCVVQIISARNDMFSNVFEIAIATIISFIAAALASTQVFCYTALVSGGVVLILPGYIVLTGALELASRNITAGAVRIGYSMSILPLPLLAMLTCQVSSIPCSLDSVFRLEQRFTIRSLV